MYIYIYTCVYIYIYIYIYDICTSTSRLIHHGSEAPRFPRGYHMWLPAGPAARWRNQLQAEVNRWNLPKSNSLADIHQPNGYIYQ